MAVETTESSREPGRVPILSVRFSAGHVAARHARRHAAAEYVAAVASPAGADPGMAAREVSAAVFELLELVAATHRAGDVALDVFAVPGGVGVRAALPADGTAQRWADWLAPSPAEADPAAWSAGLAARLAAPDPADGLRELRALHHVELAFVGDAAQAAVWMRIPLEGGAADGD